MEKDGQTVTSHEIWYPREVSCSCRIEDSLLFLLFFFFFMLWWLNCDGRQIRRIKGSYCFDLCMRERERGLYGLGEEVRKTSWNEYIHTHRVIERNGQIQIERSDVFVHSKKMLEIVLSFFFRELVWWGPSAFFRFTRLAVYLSSLATPSQWIFVGF